MFIYFTPHKQSIFQERADMNKNLVKTGAPGFDTVLGGGLPGGRAYLIDGLPGTGKTTFGLQFLLEGKKSGERVMGSALSKQAKSFPTWPCHTDGPWRE